MSRRAFGLELLLFSSGFCGIAYEILYARLLGNLFGSQFVINASILCAFLLGIGLGALVAHRLVRWLWLIEIGIGLYAGLMALLHPWVGQLLYAAFPALGASLAGCALVTIALLLIPALLIGCSVPLFAAYLGRLRRRRVFSTTYELYNLGAACTVIAIEFVALRALGIRQTTLMLAALNIGIGLALLWGYAESAWALAPRRPAGRWRFAAAVLGALALAGVASAIFQALMLKVAELLFGPYNETFALVLATVLLGLAAGSAATARWGLGFRGSLVLALVGLAALVILLPRVGELYAWAYPTASASHSLLVLIKLGAVGLLMGPAAVGFGALIPALLVEHQQVARESGQLLFVSALANAGGFLLMVLALHPRLSYGTILLLVVLLTAGALLLTTRGMPALAALGLIGAVLLAVGGGWREERLFVGYTSFRSLDTLRERWAEGPEVEAFRGHEDLFAVIQREGEPYLFLNGYISIPLRSNAEAMVGALSAMLAPRHDRALVLGLGSGASAGAVSLMFERTDVVEINRVLLDHLDRMEEYSFDIATRPGVRLVHDDAIHFVSRPDPEPYSLVLNTVTTPLYFSSSKLYTREFLAAVRARLSADGLYVTWLDSRVGDRGFELILDTLAGEFAACWLSYMNDAYFLLACSDERIEARGLASVLARPELAERLGERRGVPIALAPYAVISADALSLRSSVGGPVNTLDRPLLEFEMARLQPGGFDGVWQRMRAGLDPADVQRALADELVWDPAAFLVALDLQTGKDARLNTFLRAAVVERHPEAVGGEYVRAANGAARAVGGAAALEKVGKRLLGRGHYAAAAELFLEASRLEPDRPGLDYYLGSSQYGGARYEEALLAFQRHWRLGRDPRSALGTARTLIALGRPSEALVLLADLPDAGTSAEVAWLRSRAFEDLGDEPHRLMELRRALHLDPAHAEARAALLDGRPNRGEMAAPVRGGPQPAR